MRACMVAYTGYDSDNRVLRYAESLVRQGYRVDAIALRTETTIAPNEINGVRVLRIQKRVRDEKSKFTYLWRLIQFFFRSMFVLIREHLKEPYDLIHVHTVPDFEVFAAWFPKLTGAKIILDIHDILPEFYASKFGTSHKSLSFKLLVAMERLSAAFADHVIAANHIWEERLVGRSVPAGKCTTFLNYPDPTIVRRRGKSRDDGKLVLLYPGTVNYHQGVDIAVRAFAKIESKVPNAEFHIYGGGDQRDPLMKLIGELEVSGRVFLHDPVPFRQIAPIIEDADIGVVPKRKNTFGNEAFSTKILEFMALGVPAIIPDTDIDRYYFNDSVASFFRANDEDSLAATMLTLIQDQQRRELQAQNALSFVKRYCWQANEPSYLSLVNRLLGSVSEEAPLTEESLR